MTTHEIRKENFDAILARLDGLRFTVWAALAKHGPGTTRQIAAWTGLDILTVRPRVTELCDMGFAFLSDKHRREGIYAARTHEEARAAHEADRSTQTRQLPLL